MATVIIDRKIVGLFKKFVLNDLKISQMDLSTTSEVFLCQIFKEYKAWSMDIKRPYSGQIFTVHSTKAQKNQFIYDCRVTINNNIRPEGSYTLKVNHVFGLNAFCDIYNGNTTVDMPEENTLLLLTNNTITILADIIPNKNIFYAVNIWATEKFPFKKIFAQLDEFIPVDQLDLSLTFMESSNISFGLRCKECDGNAWIYCHSCNGTGFYKPSVICFKCNGAGHFSVACNRCDGKGYVTCKKCSGTGEFIGKFGDRLQCRPCNGSGRWQCIKCKGDTYITLECTVCHGKGTLDAIECNNCDGKGVHNCKTCYSTGYLKTSFNSKTGTFNLKRSKSQNVPSSEVQLIDWNNNSVIENVYEANVVLGKIDTIRKNPKDIQAIESHINEIRQLEICLTNSLKAQALGGIYRIQLKKPSEIPFENQKKKYIYPFPIVNQEYSWLEENRLPYPPGTSLTFYKKNSDIKSIVAVDPEELGENDRIGKVLRPIFRNIEDHESGKVFMIQFLKKPYFAGLPTIIDVNPDIITPSETIQIRHLRQWSNIENKFNPILKAIATDTSKSVEIPSLELFNTQIGQYSSQIKAVEMGVAHLPLGLIKGPPGTGKTTVITEIVQQMVARGNRVLVCSQTHQAVGNVLEKLHFLGRYNMARHGDKENLSDIEAQYHYTTDNDDSKKEARKKLEEFYELNEKFSTILKNIDKALQASIELKNNRYHANKLKESIIDNLHLSLTEIDSIINEINNNHNNDALQRIKQEVVSPAIISFQISLQFKDLKNHLTPNLFSQNDIRILTDFFNKIIGTIKQSKSRYFAVSNELRKIEKKLITPQKKCIRLIKDYVEIGKNELLPSEWEQIKEKIEKINQKLLSEIGEYDFEIDINKNQKVSEKIYQYEVFFSTCVGLASWRDLIKSQICPIDLVIIDEAGHATIPETIIPLQFSKRALLIGDEKQLPPLIPSNIICNGEKGTTACFLEQNNNDEEETNCQLGTSFFEQLWAKKAHLSKIMLDVQFRMHPKISDFVSTFFYEGNLHNGISSADRELSFGCFTEPICLIPTSSYKNKYENFLNPGYNNELEAEIIFHILNEAKNELPDRKRFGIITPYAGQVEIINEKVAGSVSDSWKVILDKDDIASVDKFQGAERDIIIVSFVRSPRNCPECRGIPGHSCSKCGGKGFVGTKMGFVRDLQRLNVAFSRAKYMLILVGDIEALSNNFYQGGIEGSEILAEFHQYVNDNGKVLKLWEKSFR